MFFDIRSDGKIMVCAQEQISSRLVELTPPKNFKVEDMADWRVIDGVFVHEPVLVDDPLPTPEERITALEEQLAAAKILLGVE